MTTFGMNLAKTKAIFLYVCVPANKKDPKAALRNICRWAYWDNRYFNYVFFILRKIESIILGNHHLS